MSRRVKSLFSTARVALTAEQSAKARRAINAWQELAARNLGLAVSTEKLLARKEYIRRWRDSQIPKSRKCPQCGITKIDRARWTPHGICRACNRTKKGKKVDPTFSPEATYLVPKDALKHLLISDIADDCGWSRRVATRAKKEGIVFSKDKEAYEKAYGRLTYVKEMRYRAPNLKEVRRSIGVSAKDFAKIMGWSEQRQNRLERLESTLSTVEVSRITKFIVQKREK